ncbi:MAG: hypothetical protein U0V48_19315 [Anaerolineales bacterium]
MNETLLSRAEGIPAKNDTARDIIGAIAANLRGYDGSTQIAAVADTRLMGGGTAATAHADIPSSRSSPSTGGGAAGGCFQSITNDGSIDVDSGHGTHTSGSVLSDGGLGGIGMGVAPAARLVFQSTENWATVTSFCQIFWRLSRERIFPDPDFKRFENAVSTGVQRRRAHPFQFRDRRRLAITPWTAPTPTRSFGPNRDMVITFSAGNEGIELKQRRRD